MNAFLPKFWIYGNPWFYLEKQLQLLVAIFSQTQ